LVLIGAGTAFHCDGASHLCLVAVAAIVAAIAAGIVGAPALFAARRAGLRGMWGDRRVRAADRRRPRLRRPIAASTGRLNTVHLNNAYAFFAAIVGAATGAIYGTLFDTDGLSGPQVRSRTIRDPGGRGRSSRCVSLVLACPLRG
jgi:hypothetical protein